MKKRHPEPTGQRPLAARARHHGGPPPVPDGHAPAEVQAEARALFRKRLNWLDSVIDGAHIEVERIVYDRDGTEIDYRRIRQRPSLKERMEAMDMLGKYGRLAAPTVVGADGEAHDEDDFALAQSIVRLLDARPATGTEG